MKFGEFFHEDVFYHIWIGHHQKRLTKYIYAKKVKKKSEL